MKQINLICLVLIGLAASCSGPQKEETAKKEVKTDSSEIKSLRVADDQLVVPGKKAGKFYLGEDISEVFKILGDADDGDAAMGKAWSIWHVKNQSDTGNIAIYSTYKDSTMMGKSVRQIVVSTNNYQTENGIKNNIDLATIQKNVLSVGLAAIYVNKSKTDTLFIYDAVTEGIAFDVKRENGRLISKAMTIHPKNESVNNTYLTIHPGWTKVQ